MSISKDRWIAVTESLPDAGRGDLLLYQDHRDGFGSQAVGYFAGGEFWLYEGDNITAEVANVTITHWRPLPPDPDRMTRTCNP
jgi:hypothetical protein